MSSQNNYPPGPDGLPVVGNTPEVSQDILKFFEHMRDEHGPIASYEIFGTESCMVADPHAVKEILLTSHDDYRKGEVLSRNLSDAMGDGLFVSEGEQWQKQRTRMLPAFYQERLRTYVPQMKASIDAQVEDWSDGDVIDVNQAMTRTTIDILGKTLFGIDVGQNPVVSDASEAIMDRFDTDRFSSFLPDVIPTPTNLRYKHELNNLNEFIDDLVEKRLQEKPEERGDDLLSILVEILQKGEFSRQEVRDNLVTFLFAGHETTSLGLTYSLLCLSDHPESQDRVHSEVEAVCDGAITASDLPELESTMNAIDEAMRLYPPVYMFFRESPVDVELGGYDIPAGTTLVVPQWVTHHDPEWWDEPDVYDPSRFEDEADRPEYAFFPFGGGPRHCIGMRFARMEMKLILSRILQEFRLELVSDSDPELTASTNLKPANPIKVRLQERPKSDQRHSGSPNPMDRFELPTTEVVEFSVDSRSGH